MHIEKSAKGFGNSICESLQQSVTLLQVTLHNLASFERNEAASRCQDMVAQPMQWTKLLLMFLRLGAISDFLSP
jgi:hypothetical protein